MTIRYNPALTDSEILDIRRQIKANCDYCPCALVQNEDTLCMCKEFREMDEGVCHCGLYVKTQKDIEE